MLQSKTIERDYCIMLTAATAARPRRQHQRWDHPTPGPAHSSDNTALQSKRLESSPCVVKKQLPAPSMAARQWRPNILPERRASGANARFTGRIFRLGCDCKRPTEHSWNTPPPCTTPVCGSSVVLLGLEWINRARSGWRGY
jgi:hypothetical protein